MTKDSTITIGTNSSAIEDSFPVIFYAVISVIIALILVFSPNVNGARTANTTAGCVSTIFITLFLLLILYDKVPKLVIWIVIAISIIIEIFIVFWFGFYTNNKSIFD